MYKPLENDFQEIFHIHTWRCKHASMEEDYCYVESAMKLGATRIVFTDHSPFPDNPFTNRMDMEQLPEYIELPVTKGQLLTMNDLAALCGKVVYQIDIIRGVNFVYRGSGTVYKFLESGIAEIDCFVYPKRITEDNQENYVFDLPEDLLEIVPYGVAADLLKSDQSAEFGTIYAKRYETMKQQLDPRYMMGSIYCEGGVML